MPVLRGRWTPEDREEQLNRLIPVEVPAGAPALTVTLTYDRRGAVIDLGARAPDGYRGWSGSDKEGFTITPTAATPSYLPGPIEGTWQILNGLHRVPPGGVEWELRIDLAPATVPPMDRRRRSRSGRRGAISRRRPAGAGSPATCTRTRSTPTESSRCTASPASRARVGWTSWASPTTTRRATTRSYRPPPHTRT